MKMKINKLYNILFLYLGLTLVFVSCQEEEEYDFNSIIPVVKTISGIATPMQAVL
jgi:hypothetical protein